MLPDMPKLKAEIAAKLRTVFKQRVNVYLGAINKAPRCLIKEGRRVVIIRPDGTRDETALEQASAETTIRLDEVPHVSFAERVAKFDDAARVMARQISEHAFGEINTAVERIGNVVHGGGKPLEPESILKVFEKIHLDFDEQGNPHQLTLVIPVGMQQKAKEAMAKIDEDPHYKRLYAELIDKKRMEWRDREAARKLVG